MTFLLAISSLLSRLIGVYRNHALANLFGASELSDAYFAAFQIPDTLYRLLVFGAISASFVPLFLELKKRDSSEAWQFVSSVLNGFLLFVAIVALVIFIFASQFVALIYPYFSVELQETTAILLRVMLLSPIFFTFSSIFSGVQNAFRNFWGFAMAPIVYNLGIIFGILALAPSMGIIGVAYGVVLGAFLHAFVQFVPAVKLGFYWKSTLVWSASFKKLLITSVPRILSMAGFQLNFFIEGIIATTLIAGNLTVLRYAQDLQSFPIGIIGVSIALSSFSILSHMAIDGELAKLASYVQKKLDHLFILIIPAAFGLFVLRYPISKLILEGGVFDVAAVDLTAQILGFLCIGLVSAAVLPLISRVFFAFHDTFWPFVVTVVVVVLNTALAIYLSIEIGVLGIGLASSVSSTVSLVAMMAILRWKHLKAETFFSVKNFVIFVLASGSMAYLVTNIMNFVEMSDSWLVLLAQIIGLAGFGIVIYGAVLFLFFKRRLFGMISSLGS